MNIPELRIGDLQPKYPIIQGGMAIRVSMAELAAAVAEEGGIGLLAGTALTPEELREEIKKAKDKTDGIIGVNIMFAASDFLNLIKESISSQIDLIVSGAGFSRDMFGLGQEAGVPIVPIVSSLKLAKISEKLGASAVVVEGGEAGGHLGTDEDSATLLARIKDKISIPVITAGDIVTPQDVVGAFKRGADGVQMGTRFLASKEASVADYFKDLVVKSSKSDVVKIMSSVGLPARAIKNRLVGQILDEEAPPPTECIDCLKKCSKKFCVRDLLLKGKAGDEQDGLFFTGAGIEKIKEIKSVKEIFAEINAEFAQA
ncbi:MAG: NAD(P)H-dependent flavin oxidoreductase [Bacillota bacterium]